MTFARIAHIALPCAFLITTLSAQTVPNGWKVIKDKKNLCQIAAPADWAADKIMVTSLTAPGGKSSFVMGAKPAEVTYAQIVDMAKQMFKPATMFEENASRTWFASAPASTGKNSWYAATGGAQVCEVQVEFYDKAFEPTAKQIVNSLGKVK